MKKPNKKKDMDYNKHGPKEPWATLSFVIFWLAVVHGIYRGILYLINLF